MPYKPKKPPQTYGDMVEQQTEQREKKSNFYKAASNEERRTELSALTGRISQELNEKRSGEKIQLVNGNLAQVQEQTLLYFTACETAGTLPSFIGLCRALGYSRQAVYKFLGAYGDTLIGAWLELAKDATSDALDAAALSNTVNPVVSIFIQKSVYERRESIELIPAQPFNPLGTPRSMAEIEAFAASMPED